MSVNQVNGYPRSEVYATLLIEASNGMLKNSAIEGDFLVAILLELSNQYQECKYREDAEQESDAEVRAEFDCLPEELKAELVETVSNTVDAIKRAFSQENGKGGL